MQDRETELRPLMIAACDGDQAAYAALLSGMATLLRGFFRKRMLSVPDDVEDVVQEVLIAIHNQRHTYDAGQPVTEADVTLDESQPIVSLRRELAATAW